MMGYIGTLAQVPLCYMHWSQLLITLLHLCGHVGPPELVL